MTALAAVAAPAAGTVPVLEHYRQLFGTLPAECAAQPDRAAALERFLQAGFPAQREEAWKYTSLRRLESRRYVLPALVPAPDGAVPAADGLAPHHLLVVDGAVAPVVGAGLPPGLALRTLDPNAAAAQPAALAALELRGGAARFQALNAAFARQALELSVAAGAVVADPVHLALVNRGPDATLLTPRVLVRLAPGARLALIVEHAGDDAAERFVASVLALELGSGAQLDLYRLQRLGGRSQLIETLSATVGADAQLRCFDASFGASLARLDVDVSLEAPGAAAELHGLFLADAQRHLDTQVRVEHRAPATRSEQVYRGIAAGRGRGVLLGKAVVHQDAQKSNARQSLKSLLLTAGAEIDVKPDLEIYADDVQCSHGATIGQLDAAALFYLRSRGLSAREARRLLTRAFAGEVLARMRELPAFEQAVHALVDQRLDALIEAVA